jgi:hypothetical protein
MNAFLLFVALVSSQGLDPQLARPFSTEAECETALAEVLKQIPADADMLFVASCTRIKNASEKAS